MKNGRLLFASIHCYLDPSSGAALATRELLELLAARGWDCRALTCGILDYQRETSLDELLTVLELAGPARRLSASLGHAGAAEVVNLTLDGVRVTVMPTASSRAERRPNPLDGERFLELAGQVLDRFRPDVMLTYGGHAVSLELMRRTAPAARRSSSTCTTSATTTAAGSPTPRPCCSPPSIPAATTCAGWVWTAP